MQASIIAFDNVTDIDVFFLWDLLNRVRSPNWTVRILGERERLISSTGMEIEPVRAAPVRRSARKSCCSAADRERDSCGMIERSSHN